MLTRTVTTSTCRAPAPLVPIRILPPLSSLIRPASSSTFTSLPLLPTMENLDQLPIALHHRSHAWLGASVVDSIQRVSNGVFLAHQHRFEAGAFLMFGRFHSKNQWAITQSSVLPRG